MSDRAEQLTDGELATLRDVRDSDCLIHDGETIETLLGKSLIVYVDGCYRVTAEGARYLVRRSPED